MPIIGLSINKKGVFISFYDSGLKDKINQLYKFIFDSYSNS